MNEFTQRRGYLLCIQEKCNGIIPYWGNLTNERILDLGRIAQSSVDVGNTSKSNSAIEIIDLTEDDVGADADQISDQHEVNYFPI